MNTPKPPRAVWHKATRKMGIDVWWFYIAYTCPSRRKFFRLYDDLEEGKAAAAHFIATGEKPPKKETVLNPNKPERKATLKPGRRTASGSRRYDVTGRVGRGKAAQYLYVGSFPDLETAKAKAKIFEETGQRFAGRGSRFGTGAKDRAAALASARPRPVEKRPIPAPAVKNTRDQVAPPVNKWAARYGNSY